MITPHFELHPENWILKTVYLILEFIIEAYPFLTLDQPEKRSDYGRNCSVTASRDSAIQGPIWPLTQWFLTFYLVCLGRVWGVSTLQLETTYKTDWYMLQCSRAAMAGAAGQKLSTSRCHREWKQASVRKSLVNRNMVYYDTMF